MDFEWQRLPAPTSLSGPGYNKFAPRWDNLIREGINEAHWYWSFTQLDWMYRPPEHFEVTGISLEVPSVDLNQTSYAVFATLQKTWESVNTNQPNAIWSPRNGQWFGWKPLTVSPPPPPVPPPWVIEMTNELAQIDRMTNLSPAEKELAKSAVRRRFLGLADPSG